MNERHLGDTLDDFLEEAGLLVEAEKAANKRVLIYQSQSSNWAE